MMRVGHLPGDYGLSIMDISSTGLKARVEIGLMKGTRVEVELRNIGWVPGQVAWVGGNGTVGIRLARVIQPELTRNQVTGSYGQAPVGTPVLRRL